jgi:predicted DNA-binding protein
MAGRHKVEKPRDIEIRFRVNEDENEKIEALAKKIGINKSKLIRNIVLGDIKEANLLYNIGIIPIVKEALKFTSRLRGEDFEAESMKDDQ